MRERVPRSLRARLVALVLLATGFSWGLSVYTVYIDARAEARAMFDASLAQTARILTTLIRHEIVEGDLEAFNLLDPAVAPKYRYESPIVALVRDADGAVLLRSPDSPLFPAAIPRGFDNRRIDGVDWRVMTMREPETGVTVHTAVALAARNRLARNLVWDSFGPLLVVLPVVIVLMMLAIGAGLRPLERLAGEVARRAPDMMAPIEPRFAPVEVRPLFDAVNSLLGRLDAALARERRFTGDASHELRTPLAVLRTNAQVALRSVDPEQRERALRTLIEGVDRCTHLVERLLTLARMDAGIARGALQPVDLREVVEDVEIAYRAQAESRGIELGFEAPDEPVLVRGEPGALHVLVRNLVDNALRYSDPDTRVDVRLTSDAGGVLLSVSDHGPGIPPEARERVFERFLRLPTTKASGSGIGLSIVQRVAELHSATVELDDAPGGGLLVRVRFDAGGAVAPPLPAWDGS